MILIEKGIGKDVKILEADRNKIPKWIPRGYPNVWTNGVFDILHAGHLRLFQFCKKHGLVIVGVNSNESAASLDKSHPLINDDWGRAIIVASQKDVDFVIIFDEPNPVACMELIKPDYFVKGGDYTIDQLPENEKAVVESYGGKVLVSGNVEGKSTSNIYDTIYKHGYSQAFKDGLWRGKVEGINP